MKDEPLEKEDIGGSGVVDLGSIDLSHYNENVIPEIQFYEIAADDVTETGRRVQIRKEEWKGQSCVKATNAMVSFFFELASKWESDPDIKALMDHCGIKLTKEE